LALLRWWGERIRDHGLRISPALSLGGLALAAATLTVYSVVLFAVASALGASTVAGTRLRATVELTPAIAFVLVNPVFEEFFVAGFLIRTSTRRRGAAFAVFLSTLVRLSYHTYQGVPGILGNLCVGVLFAFVYLRWRQLWPLILAHMALDAIGLIQATARS
jgi:membrane protease YdiL (CAAX protease family)